MSWEEDFDTALASHPWRPLTASGHITSHSTTTSSFILKHAPHPSRPGYIVLLTDLSSVYLEELTAPGVPSRLREVARLPPLAKAANGKGKKQEVEDEEDMDDIVKQSEAALKRVQGLCAALTGREGEGEEGEVQASVEAGDYHDAVLTIRSNTFSWIFNLTEIKGRQPLEILATQLIGPLASQALLSDAANGQTKKRDAIAIDFLHTLFSASAYKGDNTSRAKPVLTPEPRSSKGKASRETPSPSAQGSPSPARRRAPSGRPTPVVHASRPRPRSKAGKVADPADASDEEANRQDEDLQESPEYASPSPTPVKPKTKRSTPGRKTHASSSPEAQASVKPGATSTSTIKSDRDHVTRKAAESPSRESPASAAASAPASPSPTPAPDASNGAEAEPEIDASQAASQAKSQTKRQREEAEEAELEKRAEEMKRKMAGGGGGGGVLGRRRLRR